MLPEPGLNPLTSEHRTFGAFQAQFALLKNQRDTSSSQRPTEGFSG